MGYVTLILDSADLQEGGMWVDQGTEQCSDPEFQLPVTLHQDDLLEGTFVIALCADGKLVPYTWTCDNGDFRASSYDGVMHGGTRQQFRRYVEQVAHRQKLFGRPARELVHLPRGS